VPKTRKIKFDITEDEEVMIKLLEKPDRIPFSVELEACKDPA